MLTRLYIHNYKCYQNFEFDLGKIREALIIGANGVGKSTIGHVLWILQRIGRGECQIDELIKINDAFELANNGVVRIEASFEVDSSEYTYGFSLELPSGFKKLRVADERLVYNGETVFSRERAQVVLQSAHGGESRFLLDWHELALPRIFIQEGLTPSAVMRVREIFSAILILVPNPDEVGAAVGDEAADYLEPTGKNLAGWIENLISSKHEIYGNIVAWIRESVGDFQGFRQSSAKDIQWPERSLLLKFKVEGGDESREIPLRDLSSGEKMFLLAAAVMAKNELDGPVLCFWDEPDNFYSIREIGRVMASLRHAFSNGGQLVVTSHSDEAIMKFPRESTYCLMRRSHLEPTSPIKCVVDRQRELGVKGDFRTALLMGDY